MKKKFSVELFYEIEYEIEAENEDEAIEQIRRMCDYEFSKD